MTFGGCLAGSTVSIRRLEGGNIDGRISMQQERLHANKLVKTVTAEVLEDL